MNKKTKNFLWILGIILIIGIIFSINGFKSPASISDDKSNIPSGNYINVPTFMYYECSPASSKASSPNQNIVNGDVKWVACPDNTDECDIVVQSSEPNFWTILLGKRQVKYQICELPSITNCQSIQYIDSGSFFNQGGIPTTKISLLKNQAIHIEYQQCSNFVLYCLLWFNTNGGYYHADYKPFVLWKNPFLGGRWQYTNVSQGCNFPTSNKQVIQGQTYTPVGNNLNSITNMINIASHNQDSTDDTKIDPYRTRNFIDGFTPMSVENVNFVKYNNQDGYCFNNIVYSISEINTKSGKYKIVDTRYNTILAPLVTCCPGDTESGKQCNSNFQWVPTSQSQCDNGFNPCRDSLPSPAVCGQKKLIYYNCENPEEDNSYCKQYSQNVECTCNSDCIDNPNGNYCDLKEYKCVDLDKPKIYCPIKCKVDNDCANCSSIVSGFSFKCNSGSCYGTPNSIKICESCDDFALSYIFGNINKDIKCQPKQGSLLVGIFETIFNGIFGKVLPEDYPQNTTLCIFSFLKLGAVLLVFIFTLLFGMDFLDRFKNLRGKNKGIIRLAISIILAVILAYITFIAFLFGIIIFIVFLLIKFGIKSLNIFKN